METFTQSDIFLSLVGISQIIIAIFGIFILGLLVKILSDISEIMTSIKKEAKSMIADVRVIRTEAKQVTSNAISQFATLASIGGIKKIFGFLDNVLSNQFKTSTPRRKSTSRRKSADKQD